MARTEIRAEASLETTKFQRGLAKAESGIKKFAKSAMSSFGAIAGAGAIAGMVRNLSSYVNEMENAAKIAGESSENFQRFAFATKTVGIEQEKAADILKDVKDKVGDFLATGAGPMADFFEKIAPKVGVTAEQFKNLSGKDALQLYVSSLEKANVSSNEMTFYMEAIASDATALIPLLKNGGKELGILADKADRVGAVIDSKTSKQIKVMNDSLKQVGMVALASTAKFIEFGNGVFETMFAAADSVIRGTNTFQELRDAEIKAEEAARDLTQAQMMQAAQAEAATLVNNMLTEAFEGQAMTIDQLLSMEQKWAKENQANKQKRLKKMEEEKRATQDQMILDQELDALRLKSEGKEKEAEALEKRIELMKETIKIARKYGLSIREASKLVIVDDDPKSATADDSGGGEGKAFKGQTLGEAMAEAKKGGIRFQRTKGRKGQEFFQRFENGRKAGKFTKEQLEAAAAKRPKAKDPAEQAAEQTKILESIDREIRKNP